MRLLGATLVLACLAVVIVVGAAPKRYDALAAWWDARERERKG